MPKCKRCGHIWVKRVGHNPIECPRCKSTLYMKARKRKR